MKNIPPWHIIIVDIYAVAFVVQIIYNHQIKKPKDPLISQTRAFYCAQMPDTSTGANVWTVMYRKDDEIKPWLKMVPSMGYGWETQQRCEKTAKTIDKYRKDSLMTLEYRADQFTPNQFILCAKTKISGENCPIVITLNSENDPYNELHTVAGTLIGGYGAKQNYKNSNTATLLIVNLADQLAEVDKKL
ncbi:MAG: COP23 domain-containing protein [Microcoleus vaginatus WJT46-NPBG5]|nr:COP23 domain-containing protein [Microcoleus vaginatus WJT46-NPBG5]